MNRIFNLRFVSLLTRNAVNLQVCNRNLSYAQKFKNNVLSRNYCSSDSSSEECEWMNDELLEKMTKDDPELERKIKFLLAEMDDWKHDGVLVPRRMLEKHWKEYIELGGFMRKRSYLQYIAKNEFKAANMKAKMERKVKEYHAQLGEINLPDHIEYGLGKNAFFLRIKEKQLATQLNCKVLAADLFDNRIIFDLGYERYMTRRQVKECAKQLLTAFVQSRLHCIPFYFHLCNYAKDTLLDEKIETIFSGELKNFPISVHSESYLDLFDKNRLVYLSPDSPYELEYNANDIYIIGAYIDTGAKLPLSFAKAKAEKIRTAKFPLDRYLKWKQGQKSLPLMTCVNILADYIYYRNWPIALKNIPRRLIDVYDEEDVEILSSSERKSERT